MAFFDGLFEKIERRAQGSALLGRVERFFDDVMLDDASRRALEAAERALEDGQAEIAEGRFLEVLAAHPHLGRAALGLAQARSALKDIPGTFAALQEARALSPADPRLALWEARVALEAGEPERARESAAFAARGLVADDRAFADASATLAWAEWRLGRPDRAARELRKALHKDERPELRVALVAALVDAGDARGAKTVAASLNAGELGASDAERVGEALLRAQSSALATPFLKAAAEAGAVDAWTSLARVALEDVDAGGSLDDALAAARLAVARGAGPGALVVLADVLVRAEDDAGAADALMAAFEQSDDRSFLRRALCVAPPSKARELAKGLDDDEPLAGAAMLLSPADDEELDQVAEALGARADREEVEPRVRLALALHYAKRDVVQARRHLDAFGATGFRTRSDEGRARELRRALLRSQWRNADGELDLAAAIDATSRFGESRAMDDVVSGAARLREDLDRPLLLGVLGEFNAGKSTFINAFIGKSIAPMGIVPTTATLNVIRGGAEELVRVHFRDGSRREGPHERLRALLEGLEALGSDSDGAAQIDRVEVVLQDPLLERVWLVDSPGTNALDPEHEKLAKEAARRADAVLWVFDASQAGKLSETEMHTALRDEGRKVIPVLNKADRLKDGELADVVAVIEEGFGTAPIALSAKAALKARLAKDDAALEASGFGSLLRHLEGAVFGASRALKRRATAGRLRRLLEDAAAREQHGVGELGERRTILLAHQARAERASQAAALAVDDGLRELQRRLDATFESAIGELMSLSAPKKALHREDRVFLEELIERGVSNAVDSALRRLRARLNATLDGVPGTLDLRELEHALARFTGRQRGRVEAGLVHAMKGARESADDVRASFAPLRVDVRDRLRDGLVEGAERAVRARFDRVREELEALAREERRVEAEVLEPLAALLDALDLDRTPTP